MAPVPVITVLSGVMETFFVPLMLERTYAKLGAVSLTAIVTVALPVPPGPLATTVSTADVNATVGVPLMMPLVVFKVMPFGKLLPLLKA
jgi:hypothetical protein